MKRIVAVLAFLSLGPSLPVSHQFLVKPAFAQESAVQQKINALKRSQATGGAETAFMSAGSATMYGIEWLEKKKYIEASWRFQEAIKTDPEYAIAHFLLGRAYAGMGQKELARESFAEAARLNPNFGAEAELEAARLAPPAPKPQPTATKPVVQKPAAPQKKPPQKNAPANSAATHSGTKTTQINTTQAQSGLCDWALRDHERQSTGGRADSRFRRREKR